MNASGPEAPSWRARATFPKNSSIKEIRGEVVGSSGVMARSMDLWRGYSHPATHVTERKPYEFRSLHSMRMPERQDLIA